MPGFLIKQLFEESAPLPYLAFEINKNTYFEVMVCTTGEAIVYELFPFSVSPALWSLPLPPDNPCFHLCPIHPSSPDVHTRHLLNTCFFSESVLASDLRPWIRQTNLYGFNASVLCVFLMMQKEKPVLEGTNPAKLLVRNIQSPLVPLRRWHWYALSSPRWVPTNPWTAPICNTELCHPSPSHSVVSLSRRNVEPRWIEQLLHTLPSPVTSNVPMSFHTSKHFVTVLQRKPSFR